MARQCDNCERSMGNLEQAYEWGEYAVCADCYNILANAAAPQATDPLAQLASAQRPAAGSTIVVANSSSSSSGGAAVLSFIFPGLGQLYQGRVGSGFAWMIFVIAGYVCFIIPGIILHIMCIANAASYRPARPLVQVYRQ